MSNILNNITCAATGANTGLPDCPYIPGKIVGAILLDKDFTFESADILTVAAFKARLQALALAAADERIFPIGPFEAITDGSEEPVKVTTGYGTEQIVRDGKIKWTFEIEKGGVQLMKALRKFNKAKKRVLFIDDNNVILGYNGTAGFTGFLLDQIYTQGFKINDGSNPSKFMIQFHLAKPSEMNDDVNYIDFGEDVLDAVKGILDVYLTKILTSTTEITISAKTVADNVDLYDSFDDEINAAGAWIVTKAGVKVTPASVAKVAGSKAWKITLTTPSGAHVFSLNTPAALAALSVGGAPSVGYESDTITHTF